jgi:hypothetical protein
MSSTNSYAPFNENNNETYSSVNRTFEELISERGDLNIYFSNTSNTSNTSGLSIDYNTLFEKIKTKLLRIDTISDIDITNCPIINKYREDFLALKKNICDIYLDYMKSETELNEAKEKYTTFCESIKNCVHFIHKTGTADENDILIKEMLEKKIEDYYEKLNISFLIQNFDEKRLDFEKTKYKISTITGALLPTTICQICLENQVDYFVDPCGHTICKTCKNTCENKSKNCHYCRTVKNGYKRLYI